MIDNYTIYLNPIIPPDFYYAKIIHLETEPAAFQFPKILTKLSIHPIHHLPENTILTSIIHPTNKSREHFEKFVHTFLNPDERDVSMADGRWGSIWVYNAKYDETEYSSVKFVFQPIKVKLAVWDIYEREKENSNQAG